MNEEYLIDANKNFNISSQVKEELYKQHLVKIHRFTGGFSYFD